MNDQSNSPAQGRNVFKTVIIWAFVLDLVWAIVAASFGASVVNIFGGAAGADATSLGIGTVAAWLLVFSGALFQGAVTIFVFAVIAYVFYNLFADNSHPN